MRRGRARRRRPSSSARSSAAWPDRFLHLGVEILDAKAGPRQPGRRESIEPGLVHVVRIDLHAQGARSGSTENDERIAPTRWMKSCGRSIVGEPPPKCSAWTRTPAGIRAATWRDLFVKSDQEVGDRFVVPCVLGVARAEASKACRRRDVHIERDRVAGAETLKSTTSYGFSPTPAWKCRSRRIARVHAGRSR